LAIIAQSFPGASCRSVSAAAPCTTGRPVRQPGRVVVDTTIRREGSMLNKPSEREEEYFARQMFDQKQKVEQEKQKHLADAERQKAKDLHFMKCPKCGMNLVEIDYKSIKVDRCSACEGVWLDTGELAQIVKLEKGALDRLFSVFSK
jgi:hypothetical protein